MWLIEIYNYDGRHEYVRADQIESVRKPSGRVHDHGTLVLIGGRQISFGTDSEAERVIRLLMKEPQTTGGEVR